MSEKAEVLRGIRQSLGDEFARTRRTLADLMENAGLTEQEVVEAIDSRVDLPRDLLPEEREALEFVLQHAEDEERDVLLSQVPRVRVVGHCACGCATVYLEVDERAEPASAARSPLRSEVEALSPDGDPIGGVLVFIEEGRLASLEVYSYEDPISPIPPREQLRATG